MRFEIELRKNEKVGCDVIVWIGASEVEQRLMA
jgi:hypothetical protein